MKAPFALALLASSCAYAGDPALREVFASRSIGIVRLGEVRNVGPPVRLPPQGLFQAILTPGQPPSEDARAIAATTRAAEAVLRERRRGSVVGPDSKEAKLDIELLAFDASHLTDRGELRIGARFRLVDPSSGEGIDERETKPRYVGRIQTARADDFEPYVEAFFRIALDYIPSR